MNPKGVSRRSFLRAGLFGTLGAAGVAALNWQGHASHAAADSTPTPYGGDNMAGMDMGGTPHPMVMPDVSGDVDHAANGFNPTDTLTAFDYGTLSTLPNGQTLREFEINAINKEIEIAPGIHF